MSYVELHCHSAFSFLDGASHPLELAAAAAEQGHAAIALTDHDGLHGAMALAHAAAPLGVRVITGAELTIDDGTHLTLLCEDRTGYRNLCRLVTRAHARTRDGPGREPRPPAVALQAVLDHAEGLVCLSGCAREGALAARIGRGKHREAGDVGRRLLAAFGSERLRVELQRPFERGDRRRNCLLAELAERLGVPTVATGDVHAHDRSRAALQDVFVAVRTKATLDESEPARRGNSSHVLVPPEAMARRFPDHPEAVHESGRLAERLEFDLTRDLGYRYPGADDPTADRRLAELCRERMEDRYAGRHSRAEAERRLEEELALIRSLGLSGFFLLHRDLLELAREVAHEVRGTSAARAVLPPGRGRGSSVSSIVCYLTGLSHVDPIEKDLFLGRFLNEELSALPDIDLDFPRDVRDALLPRVHERYGHERSALVAAFATYQTRSAVRDFGKALGVPPPEVERAARAVDPWGFEHVDREIAQAVGERRAASPRWQALVRLVREAAGLPRHVTQHSGGMVISTESLQDICPIQPAAMAGRQLVQWDKDSCADAGFLKIDLLGLGMLSAVERCVDEIARVRDEVIDLSRIPYDDPEVYGAIQRAETTGVFQIESRAQMQMLPRTLPENLDDVTVQVALVRPGPILGGAVHPYIERRKALRADPSYEVPYEHPLLEPVLRDTLGAIVFQDQVIEVAMTFAGFSPGEAEGLRRAMSRVRSEDAMRSYQEKFIAGAVAKGVPRATAERVYGQIVGFSGFGFPKAHSAAFGLLAYQSTWLRVHYGPEFLCSLLNEQPMGFYPPDLLVHEAQRRGIEVLPPCVQRSAVECRVEVLEPAVPPRAAAPDAPAAASPPASPAPAAASLPASTAPITRSRHLAHPVGDPAARALFQLPDASAESSPGREREPPTSPARTRLRLAPPPSSPVDHGPRLAVRVGLGYVTGARVEDVRGIVSERERGGPYSSVTDLAARCGAGRDSLDRLAWAGACDLLVPGGRRKALWLLGVSPSGVTVDGATHRAGTGTSTRPAGAAPGGPMLRADDAQPLVRPSDSKGRRTRTVTGRRVPAPTVAPPVQLALPLDPGEAPALRTMTPWERLLADYGSTKITLAEHPLALMRADLDPDVLTSVELSTAPDGSAVRVAGLVVARQRPATAKGVTFMLLEDECGTINLVVPPPVHDACRLAVRAEPFVLGAGTLERREGVINVVVTAVHRLDRHDVPPGEVRHIEPQRTWSTEETAGDLRAVAPGAHSFGRRA